MSPGKLAAQAVHAALGLSCLTDIDSEDGVVVLEASDKKFFEALDKLEEDERVFYAVADAGRTEVAPGTTTCFAILEED